MSFLPPYEFDDHGRLLFRDAELATDFHREVQILAERYRGQKQTEQMRHAFAYQVTGLMRSFGIEGRAKVNVKVISHAPESILFTGTGEVITYKHGKDLLDHSSLDITFEASN